MTKDAVKAAIRFEIAGMSAQDQKRPHNEKRMLTVIIVTATIGLVSCNEMGLNPTTELLRAQQEIADLKVRVDSLEERLQLIEAENRQRENPGPSQPASSPVEIISLPAR